jgi:hypothetical protein
MAEREVAEKVAQRIFVQCRDTRSADHPDEVDWDGAKIYNRDLKEFQNTGEVQQKPAKQLMP